MNRETIVKIMTDVILDLGIYVDKDEFNKKDVDMREYIKDSMTFISFFIGMEDALEIELPDTLLSFESLISSDSLSNSILEYYNETKNDKK